jgi:hypothetical protein
MTFWSLEFTSWLPSRSTGSARHVCQSSMTARLFLYFTSHNAS